MLFAYSFERSEVDEINHAVCAFLRLLVSGSRAGKGFNVRQCCIEPLRSRVSASRSLREKIRSFYVEFLALGGAEQQSVYKAFLLNNQVARQLSGAAQRVCLSDLPPSIRAPVADLFKELYTTAPTPSQWKQHWKSFYGRVSTKVCPFCGIERLNNPALVKQDYDHVLCQKVYPFASINCRNLVPAGTECNRIFKHEQDIIFDAGARRMAYNPFRDHGQVITIDLTGSKKPAPGDDTGTWQVKVLPDCEEVRTWTAVFKLTTRYAKNVFEQDYSTWRDEFVSWALKNTSPERKWTVAEIREQMSAYAATFDNNRLRDLRFLKQALFKFLVNENDETFFAALSRQFESENTNRRKAVDWTSLGAVSAPTIEMHAAEDPP